MSIARRDQFICTELKRQSIQAFEAAARNYLTSSVYSPVSLSLLSQNMSLIFKGTFGATINSSPAAMSRVTSYQN